MAKNETTPASASASAEETTPAGVLDLSAKYAHYQYEGEGKEKVRLDSTKEERAASVRVDFPETVEGLIEKFGAGVVAQLAETGYTYKAQAEIRRLLGEGQSPDQIQTALSAFVPSFDGRRGRTADPVAKASKAVANLNDEQFAALLRARGLDPASMGLAG